MKKIIKGSPPRVRELPVKANYWNIIERITPACAGITRSDLDAHGRGGDHPRVCGNYSSQHAVGYKRSGSPPRMRELLI